MTTQPLLAERDGRFLNYRHPRIQTPFKMRHIVVGTNIYFLGSVINPSHCFTFRAQNV